MKFIKVNDINIPDLHIYHQFRDNAFTTDQSFVADSPKVVNLLLKLDITIQSRSCPDFSGYYHHKPSLVMNKETKLRNLTKISKKEVQKIANNICNEEVNSVRLTHKEQLLFYHVYTQNCKLEINALDAEIIYS